MLYYNYTCTTLIIINANVLEQERDFWRWLYTTQFSYHCVHPNHVKMFSIQILLHFSQIVPRVCTSVLFIITVIHHLVYFYGTLLPARTATVGRILIARFHNTQSKESQEKDYSINNILPAWQFAIIKIAISLV